MVLLAAEASATDVYAQALREDDVRRGRARVPQKLRGSRVLGLGFRV